MEVSGGVKRWVGGGIMAFGDEVEGLWGWAVGHLSWGLIIIVKQRVR